MATKVEQLCDEVIAARATKDELKAQLTACEKELDSAETKLAKELAKDEAKLTHGGFIFSAASKVSWKPLKEGKDKLVELLKKGAPELVKESVNAATLNAYLRKNEGTLDEEKASWWTAAKKCVERSESTTLSVRKSSKKK